MIQFDGKNPHAMKRQKEARKSAQKKQQDFQMKFAVVLSVITLLLVVVLATLSSYPTTRQILINMSSVSSMETETLDMAFRPESGRRLDEDNNDADGGDDGADADGADDDADAADDGGGGNQYKEFSKYSCSYIYQITPDAGENQCKFARECNGYDGVWAPFVFCSKRFSIGFLSTLLSPIMIIWLIMLFRLLGSTAEDYFSPALEMFSQKCHLPPRFAGVTLLALGNGAADVSATVSAITSDPEIGYKLSLGALTGAGMFISAMISAAVILAASEEDGSGGIPCRGALVRDVVAMLITVVTVWARLRSGYIGTESVTAFLTLYCIFVVTVLVADIYHRAVVVPRMAQYKASQERLRQHEQARYAEEAINGAEGESSFPSSTPAPSAGNSRVATILSALSNYDTAVPIGPSEGADGLVRNENFSGWGVESEDLGADRPIVLHGAKGLLRHAGQGHGQTHTTPDFHDANQNDYNMLSDGVDNVCVDSSAVTDVQAPFLMVPDSWHEAVDDAKTELTQHAHSIWDDIMFNEDLNALQKFFLVLELPFTIARQSTVPIPCDGFYVRGVTAVSFALSPFWFAFYVWHSHGYNLLSQHTSLFFLHILFAAGVAASLIRFAPASYGSDSTCPMPLYFSAPIALYGFAIAATWIDTIADALVALLNFLGIICYIPGPVLGLTVLAWGNSMGDLSANITMARKGLANMAMTACFAGPVFNILLGLGLGFSTLFAKTGKTHVKVDVSTAITVGFIFLAINAVSFLWTGLVWGKGRIPYQFGYVLLSIYTVYVATSITLQYSRFGDD